MDLTEKKYLLYRRQFILTTKQITDLHHFKKIEFTKNYFLYIHPDLPFIKALKSKKQLILLGDLFDPVNSGKENIEIVNSLINANSIEELVCSVYPLAGRYAILFVKEDDIYLFNDPSASRKIFYTNHLKFNCCASEPHVLAKYLGIEKTKNDEVLAYYRSSEFFNGMKINIADNTIYDNIKQLLPNRYLVLKTGTNKRFWPNKALKKILLNEATEKASEIISNIMMSFNKRYKLMIPITAGSDSRILLAASRKIIGNIYLYINKNEGMSDDHLDIRISKSLLNKIGLKSNVHIYSNRVDKDFEEIYNLNSAFPLKENMGLIYNVYFKNFQDRINLPGSFSDISRNFFFTHKKRITPGLLTMIYMKSIHGYFIEQKYLTKNFKKWLSEIYELSNKCGYQILDLFNWEERNGNWYTKFQEDKDIAQEEFSAFNNRLFMDLCLGVHKKYRDIDTNIFYKSMVKYMWPEALSEPMYPKSWLRYYLKKTNLYLPVRMITKKF
ncbi:MAG: hypothetical protein PVF73_03595 [Bacteroidales bacterium]|jgi:hypothetical protein